MPIPKILLNLKLLLAICGGMHGIAYASPTLVNEIGTIAPGKPYSTNYYVIHGPESGPCLLINGGIHGDEIAGWTAAENIRHWQIRRGTLIVIPQMNRLACEKNKRYINIEFNHAFPGKPGGTPYENQLAYEITKLIGKFRPLVMLGLHESRVHRDATNGHHGGQVIYYGLEVTPANLKAAIRRLNEEIPEQSKRFLPIYYPVVGATSEVWMDLFGGEAYAVETWRGYSINDRVQMQQSVVKAFMIELGMI